MEQFFVPLQSLLCLPALPNSPLNTGKGQTTKSWGFFLGARQRIGKAEILQLSVKHIFDRGKGKTKCINRYCLKTDLYHSYPQTHWLIFFIS